MRGGSQRNGFRFASLNVRSVVPPSHAAVTLTQEMAANVARRDVGRHLLIFEKWRRLDSLSRFVSKPRISNVESARVHPHGDYLTGRGLLRRLPACAELMDAVLQQPGVRAFSVPERACFQVRSDRCKPGNRVRGRG